jgi:hypothetical protein
MTIDKWTFFFFSLIRKYSFSDNIQKKGVYLYFRNMILVPVIIIKKKRIIFMYLYHQLITCYKYIRVWLSVGRSRDTSYSLEGVECLHLGISVDGLF